MSDLKVVQITDTRPNGENVVQRLEESLEMAKAGNIENCMVIMANADGGVADCWANSSQPMIMVGAIEALKREFMNAVIAERQE